MNSDDSLNSSNDLLNGENNYVPPQLPGQIPLNQSYPEVLPQPAQRSQVYMPSYPILQPMPLSNEESTNFEQKSQLNVLKDQLVEDKKNLTFTLKSVKLWTIILAVIALVSSIKLVSVLGARPLVIALVLGKFLVVGLFFRHVRMARRAIRNGTTPVVKRMFKRSFRSTILIVVLAAVFLLFVGPKVGRQYHKQMKKFREMERMYLEGKSHIEPPKIEKEANIQIYIWNNPAPLFPEVDPLTKSPQEMQEVLDNFENEFSQWRDQIEERLTSYEDATEIDKSDKLDQITKEV